MKIYLDDELEPLIAGFKDSPDKVAKVTRRASGKLANMDPMLLKPFSELMRQELNDARKGLPFNIRRHRVTFSPAQNLGFISDDFANITLQLDVLAVTSVAGNGLNPFMPIDLAQ
ncbi:hypothetical protein [Endozoicomonas lisbonensis]